MQAHLHKLCFLPNIIAASVLFLEPLLVYGAAGMIGWAMRGRAWCCVVLIKLPIFAPPGKNFSQYTTVLELFNSLVQNHDITLHPGVFYVVTTLTR